MLADGTLARYLEQGVRGVTSNPTIFQKSIETDSAYAAGLAEARSVGMTAEAAYWQLVKADISTALEQLLPVYDQGPSLGDGCVSLEVSPRLAHDTKGTVDMGRQLWEDVDCPNLMIKVPATPEGLPAITQLISEGVNVNVTLIFSLERYRQVIAAYLDGLEAYHGDLDQIVSVASFFISRTDTEVDARLSKLGGTAAELQGKAAVASAQLAYEIFMSEFAGARWEALLDRGANVQRPLWASTSVKNPIYPDLLYVEPLALKNTVNTMPDATIAAVIDHATLPLHPDLGALFQAARTSLAAVAEAGVDMDDVATTLETEGVTKFQASYDDVLGAIEKQLR
jgi:transaldolase